MEKIWGYGIIGCGGIAAFHRDAIREIPNARLICVSSRTEQGAKAFAKDSGCEWTTDYLELINRSDIDIICVTTSSGSHFRISEKVLSGGKHLVVEKPISMQAIEAQILIDLAKVRGVSLSVISQRRFEPYAAYLKQVIDEGKLGRLLLVEAGTPYLRTQEYYNTAEWRGTITDDGGALMNQGIHQIDLLLWFGGEVHSVYGKTATLTHDLEVEDMAVAIVKFKSSALGTILSSTSIKPGFPPYIHIYGEKGTVKIQGQSIVHWTVEGVKAPSDTEIVVSDGSSNPLAISHRYHKLQLEEILQSIVQERPMKVTGLDGKRAVELIGAICASSASGEEIIL
ncbi:Gfo/Idh/MocA family protein [Paenibacillus sp. GCM10027628]|uniref:Gfo/Idh/MocA family protein n=1 Tax=Paenibacillus sp. GCM10027628 TaxID=3273413 RepID=UPI003638102E